MAHFLQAGLSHGRATGTPLTNPDLKAYAESFGIQALRPVRPVLECSMIIAT
jgi:hypothetical protein